MVPGRTAADKEVEWGVLWGRLPTCRTKPGRLATCRPRFVEHWGATRKVLASWMPRSSLQSATSNGLAAAGGDATAARWVGRFGWATAAHEWRAGKSDRLSKTLASLARMH